MPVDTTVTGATSVVDGGGLVALSGENLRQMFIVTIGGDLTLRNIFLVDGGNFAGLGGERGRGGQGDHRQGHRYQ